MTILDADGAPTGDGIIFYGADWCPDSRRSRALLDRHAVPYSFVDLDADATATEWAARQNGGRRRIPTIAFGAGGPVLIEPSDPELTGVLRAAGLLPAAE